MRVSAAAPIEIALLALLGVLWGMPYALTKISLASIPPMTLAAARVSLAALVLWAVVAMRGNVVPVGWRVVGRFSVQGAFACVIPYTLIAWGQQSVPSALAAILNSSTPVFVCLIGLIWSRRESVTGTNAPGLVLGLGGVIAITGASALGGLGQEAAGQAAIIAATLSSAVSAIYGRRLSEIPPEFAAAGMLTCASLVLVPMCFYVEAPFHLSPTSASLAALVVNAVVATGVGFIVYFRLIRTIGSMGTASVGYLKPAVGVLIGVAAFGEPLTGITVLGLVAIVAGVGAISGLFPIASQRAWRGSKKMAVAPRKRNGRVEVRRGS